jgi:hypothetical protein
LVVSTTIEVALGVGVFTRALRDAAEVAAAFAALALAAAAIAIAIAGATAAAVVAAARVADHAAT